MKILLSFSHADEALVRLISTKIKEQLIDSHFCIRSIKRAMFMANKPNSKKMWENMRQIITAKFEGLSNSMCRLKK